MSEEIKETTQQESMADYEDRLDPDSFDAPVWAHLHEQMDNKEVLHITVTGMTKGGLVCVVDDIRGFIPMKQISTKYVENPESYVGQELDVRIIEVSRPDKRLVLSAREVIRDKEREEREKAIAAIPVGAVLDCKVESLQPYGAFLRTEDGVSGLVHISQISTKRIKKPEDVLAIGDEVQAKVIQIKDGKLSLSIRALTDTSVEEEEPKFNRADLPKAEDVTTSLGDLLKGIKLD